MPNEAAITEAEANLRAELAAERASRMTLERMGAGRPAAPPPAPPEPDALEQFNDTAKLTPEQRTLLNKGIEQQVKRIVGPVLGQIRNENQRIAVEKSYETALGITMATNPDIDPEKLAAASAAYENELRRTGRNNLPPDEFLRGAVVKYRKLFPSATPDPTKAPPPDFVEGASSPASTAALAPSTPPEPEKKPSKLQAQYGDEEGDIIDLEAVEDPEKMIAQMTHDYAQQKNEFLEDKGMRTFIPKVRRSLMKRWKAKKAAASAAAR